MIKELGWFVAGKAYTFNVETSERDGEIFISATEMRRVNRLIASDTLEGEDKLITLDQYRFLKDVTGIEAKELSKYRDNELKELFKSKLNEI